MWMHISSKDAALLYWENGRGFIAFHVLFISLSSGSSNAYTPLPTTLATGPTPNFPPGLLGCATLAFSNTRSPTWNCRGFTRLLYCRLTRCRYNLDACFLCFFLPILSVVLIVVRRRITSYNVAYHHKQMELYLTGADTCIPWTKISALTKISLLALAKKTKQVSKAQCAPNILFYLFIGTYHHTFSAPATTELFYFLSTSKRIVSCVKRRVCYTFCCVPPGLLASLKKKKT